MDKVQGLHDIIFTDAHLNELMAVQHKLTPVLPPEHRGHISNLLSSQSVLPKTHRKSKEP